MAEQSRESNGDFCPNAVSYNTRTNVKERAYPCSISLYPGATRPPSNANSLRSTYHTSSTHFDPEKSRSYFRTFRRDNTR